MTEYLPFLIWPFLASLVLVGIHTYFGLHVIKRGIIFIDLSLAQVAAFGITMAVLMGYPTDGVISYIFALAFALVGGIIFTFTRDLKSKVPQEAIIGIVYAVSSAAAILAVSHSPEGAEHIRYLLVGSLLTVPPDAVLKTALVYAAVGSFHWLAKSKFIPLTFNKGKGPSTSKLWDFLFYASFAVVVTSSVKICGVLLVFIFLVVPSVFAAILTERIGLRLLYGWIFGFVGSALGIIVSFWLDTPTGATIVCTFGLLLLLTAAIRKL
ncbi:MAG: metal ABC transporter permease [candidate division Zixibacteria bacterium]|nr:metal ABC transporter permease [candidate division Zixibacteria bacterium]